MDDEGPSCLSENKRPSQGRFCRTQRTCLHSIPHTCGRRVGGQARSGAQHADAICPASWTAPYSYLIFKVARLAVGYVRDPGTWLMKRRGRHRRRCNGQGGTDQNYHCVLHIVRPSAGGLVSTPGLTSRGQGGDRPCGWLRPSYTNERPSTLVAMLNHRVPGLTIRSLRNGWLQ